MKRKVLVLLAVSLGGPFPFSPPRVAGLPVYRNLLEKKAGYPMSCLACHAPSNWEPTSFGKAFAKSGRALKAFEVLSPLDSDGDGRPNGEEWAARSNPGDRASVPGRPGTWLKDLPPPFVPQRRLNNLFGRSYAYVVAPSVLTEEQIRTIEKSLRTPLRDEDKYTLYYVGREKGGGAARALATYAVTDEEESNFFLVGLQGDNLFAQLLKIRKGMSPAPVGEILAAYSGQPASVLEKAAPAVAGLSPAEAEALRQSFRRSIALLREFHE